VTRRRIAYCGGPYEEQAGTVRSSCSLYFSPTDAEFTARENAGAIPGISCAISQSQTHGFYAVGPEEVLIGCGPSVNSLKIDIQF
jgi:hypothetical protein